MLPCCNVSKSEEYLSLDIYLSKWGGEGVGEMMGNKRIFIGISAVDVRKDCYFNDNSGAEYH